MDNAVGYVQNLSPSKRGKRKNTSYFDFTLQTGEQSFKRAVCFDEGLKRSFEEYQTSGIPVKIRNCTYKSNWVQPENLDVVINSRSRVEDATNGEVNFENSGRPKEAEAPEYQVLDIGSVRIGQLLTVKGLLKMDKTRVRTVEINGNAKNLLDACTITDSTGSIKVTIWGDMINTLISDHCYKFIGVRVKEYSAKVFLTTTPNTVYEEIDEEFPEPEIDLLDTLKSVAVQEVLMVNNFSSWYICKNCKKQLTQVSTIQAVKCSSCKATVAVGTCEKKASAQVAIADDEENSLWLTIFNNELQVIIQNQDPQLNALSSEDDVTSALLKATGMTIQYDTETHIVKTVTF